MLPQHLRYHNAHEWHREQGAAAAVALRAAPEAALRDLLFFQLPKVGDKLTAGQEIGEVESTKATSSIYTPVTGTVSKVNQTLNERPELANTDPSGQGWLAVIALADPKELDSLMHAKAYEAFIKAESK